MTSPRWNKHIFGCQQKGRAAAMRGEPKDSCPYKVLSPWGHTGPRNLTKQRKDAWEEGWLIGATRLEEERVALIVPGAKVEITHDSDGYKDRIGTVRSTFRNRATVDFPDGSFRSIPLYDLKIVKDEI
jgi:ribosome modulation factor